MTEPGLASGLAARRAGMAAVLGVAPEVLGADGVTIVPDLDREGTGRVSWYPIDPHAVLWVDPLLADGLRSAVNPDTALDEVGIDRLATSAGAELLWIALEHLLPDEAAPSVPAVDGLVRLDHDDPATAELVTGLLVACSEGDRDEADFDPDELDRFLAGVVSGGDLVALAGGRDDDLRPGFLDIGVLTRPSARRRGLGRAAVAAVCADIVASGERPLYRCDLANEGSWRLARSLGFVETMRIRAYRWPRGG